MYDKPERAATPRTETIQDFRPPPEPVAPRALLAHALAYAARGWPVIPLHTAADGRCTCPRGLDCTSPAKHPRCPNGLRDATPDLETIRAWWRQWPTANIGIATGPESGLLVVDIDERHAGEHTLEALVARHGRLPDTCEAMTGNGRHLYFRYPERITLSNSTNKLGPGLDIRAQGGYVVAPPSQHINGHRYAWEASSDPLAGVAIAEPPPWLIDLISAPAQTHKARAVSPRMRRFLRVNAIRT